MKLFKKLAAAALAGVMALSMLTGCAVGDAMKEDAMLTALQTIGNTSDVKISEDKDLTKKASGVFSAFKAAEGTAWSVDYPWLEDTVLYVATVTYKEVDYEVVVTALPKNAKDSTQWGRAANYIYFGLCDCAEEQEDGSRKLKVGFDVMNNVKLTDNQEKSEDYMVVFAKILEAQDGGEIIL